MTLYIAERKEGRGGEEQQKDKEDYKEDQVEKAKEQEDEEEDATNISTVNISTAGSPQIYMKINM